MMFKSKSALGFPIAFLAGIAAIWVIAILTAPMEARASHCVQWGKQCDKTGKHCISVCIAYGSHVPPFDVKKSGGTVSGSTSKKEEENSK